MDLDRLLTDLLVREGGFVNDPDDPGGATKYGITRRTLSDARGYPVSVSDVARLTRDEARAIYVKRYLRAPKIDQLPSALIPSVFDMYVNAGTQAIKILQNVLNAFGEKLKVDGVIGKRTLAAAKAVNLRVGRYLVDAYGIARRDYYYRIGDLRPASRKYARTRAGGKGGWIKRAELFISDRFRLSDAAHQARIAAWG